MSSTREERLRERRARLRQELATNDSTTTTLDREQERLQREQRRQERRLRRESLSASGHAQQEQQAAAATSGSISTAAERRAKYVQRRQEREQQQSSSTNRPHRHASDAVTAYSAPQASNAHMPSRHRSSAGTTITSTTSSTTDSTEDEIQRIRQLRVRRMSNNNSDAARLAAEREQRRARMDQRRREREAARATTSTESSSRASLSRPPSGRSLASGGTTSSVGSASHRSISNDSGRRPPARSTTSSALPPAGVVPNSATAATTTASPQEEFTRAPPLRAKSADDDLLAMDLQAHQSTHETTTNIEQQEEAAARYLQERQARRQRSVRGSGLVQTTAAASAAGATTEVARLRARREAQRKAIREQQLQQQQATTAATSVSSPTALDRAAQRRARATETQSRLARELGSVPSSTMDTAEAEASQSPTTKQPPHSSSSIPDLELSSDDGEEDASRQWSVRVCVVSAVDLPLNVVPNMPVCPILKMGLAKIPSSSSVLEKLGDKSIAHVKNAHLRATTTKILSKRDNGSVDFHQELRWDRLVHPERLALCLEVAAQAVRTPANIVASPTPLVVSGSAATKLASSGHPTTSASMHILGGSTSGNNSQAPQMMTRVNSMDALVDNGGGPAQRGVARTMSGTGDDAAPTSGGLRGLWRKTMNRKQAELDAANAAAAVARMLIEQDNPGGGGGDFDSNGGQDTLPWSAGTDADALDDGSGEQNFALKQSEEDSFELNTDFRIGSIAIPLSKLPLDKAMNDNESSRIEQWFEVDKVDEEASEVLQGAAIKRKPRVLLEITFSSIDNLDDSEDEMEDHDPALEEAGNESFNASKTLAMMHASFSRRASLDALGLRGDDKGGMQQDSKAKHDPVLDHGIIDFVAIVGAKDFGNQRNDTGGPGWIDSSPKIAILEQFPPNDEFYKNIGRSATLQNMVEWFSFPEGAKLWRGPSPPTHADLHARRFSAASPPNVSASIHAFDSCLGCSTSFSWFVIASNSDEYGSALVKTYGAVIRFYVPAPDDPEDDSVNRIWVPLGICLTANLPIVGVLEAMLLRLCESLSAAYYSCADGRWDLSGIHRDIARLALNCQKPIAGAVNCSVPFLEGGRFLITLPPPHGLPPLPHGHAIVSVCRLLGAEGLAFLLAAVLTECKILFHSEDTADIAMVAEVITGLCYPFTWSLPYIPILPMEMLEFVEAPLSYMLGVPTSSLKLIDPNALEDVVVVDLDRGFSRHTITKNPIALPASVAKSIAKAVYRLLRAEQQVEEEYGSEGFETIPRLETESLAERQFRIAVAVQVSSLLRGYQDCVGQVFNREKFLRISPALYEDKRDGVGTASSRNNGSGQKILSPRSKRFLSTLVSTQNFQQLLESLDAPSYGFFHEIMDTLDEIEKQPSRSTENASAKLDRIISQLNTTLQKVEDKIPTYRVEMSGFESDEDGEMLDEDSEGLEDFEDGFECFNGSFDENGVVESDAVMNGRPFTEILLQGSPEGSQPWSVAPTVTIPMEDIEGPLMRATEKIKLKEAIGDRRFRTWKLAQKQRMSGASAFDTTIHEEYDTTKPSSSVKLTSLISSATSDRSGSMSSLGTIRRSTLSPEQQKIQDAKNRDVLRRCLDKAQGDGDPYQSDDDLENPKNPFMENGRDLMAEAEKALNYPSAQLFLLSVLHQRARIQNAGRGSRRQTAMSTQQVARLEPIAFNCLIRLGCAMLDSCMEHRDFEPAYRLLMYTAGFIMIVEEDEEDASEAEHMASHQFITMTSRIGLHPIYADLGLWDKVMQLHMQDRLSEKKEDESEYDQTAEEEADANEYDSAVSTLYEMLGYGIPGEELSKFAMHASQEHGWFCDERGKQLLMLARRISVRREQTDHGTAGGSGDIEMMRKGQEEGISRSSSHSSLNMLEDDHSWTDIAWCHPGAPSKRTGQYEADPTVIAEGRFLKRSPVTTMASFGTSMVVSGGLDGSVFFAHDLHADKVHGINLDWGSASRATSGTASDGFYGVGAVSCLATAFGTGQHTASSQVEHAHDQEALLESMEGSRIIAGTTAGDLRVWSVKDIYTALIKAEEDVSGSLSGPNRLKFALRGRALSGHRGGVTCMDVPPHFYRPDSLVTGGADGLIKLWSLRSPTGGRRPLDEGPQEATAAPTRGRGGDALSILNGHKGRVLCTRTAWHGDRLLSGGADRTLRIWDLTAAGSGGAGGTSSASSSAGMKSLHTLTGHFGWVTHVEYWGPNTIVSASTDRSIALWDARVRSSPLFALRYHHAPISDILVGSRTDPMMVSAASDGSLSTWDFRNLSTGAGRSGGKTAEHSPCQIVRSPAATTWHTPSTVLPAATGSVLLARGVSSPRHGVLSAGGDGKIREWEISSGQLLEEHNVGHCDRISNLCSFVDGSDASTVSQPSNEKDYSFLTGSWDGTIRLRTRIKTSETN